MSVLYDGYVSNSALLIFDRIFYFRWSLCLDPALSWSTSTLSIRASNPFRVSWKISAVSVMLVETSKFELQSLMAESILKDATNRGTDCARVAEP